MRKKSSHNKKHSRRKLFGCVLYMEFRRSNNQESVSKSVGSLFRFALSSVCENVEIGKGVCEVTAADSDAALAAKLGNS